MIIVESWMSPGTSTNAPKLPREHTTNYTTQTRNTHLTRNCFSCIPVSIHLYTLHAHTLSRQYAIGRNVQTICSSKVFKLSSSCQYSLQTYSNKAFDESGPTHYLTKIFNNAHTHMGIIYNKLVCIPEEGNHNEMLCS